MSKGVIEIYRNEENDDFENDVENFLSI